MKIDDRADFGIRECPSCACEVAANHNRCPVCGYLFPAATPVRRRLRLWGALFLAGLLLFLYLWRWG